MLESELPADESEYSQTVDDGEDESAVSAELTDALQCKKSFGRSVASASSERFEVEGDIDRKLSRARLNSPRSESLRLIEGGLDGSSSHSVVFGSGSWPSHCPSFNESLRSSSSSGVCVLSSSVCCYLQW